MVMELCGGTKCFTIDTDVHCRLIEMGESIRVALRETAARESAPSNQIHHKVKVRHPFLPSVLQPQKDV